MTMNPFDFSGKTAFITGAAMALADMNPERNAANKHHHPGGQSHENQKTRND
ncbi:MAG: hypothetical protein IK129_03400 [Deltaproteobacteria bacterium]|nr:hypothetical protein [Deltaproteobacteria bacterium]MBR5705924.1 hypothetical protein [Deltaproteobacteria bacterium]